MSIFELFFDLFKNFISTPIYMIFLIIIFVVLLYLLPSLTALARQKKQFLAILLLNIFAGWTFVGWLAALIWAAIVEKSDYEGIKYKTNIKPVIRNQSTHNLYTEVPINNKKVEIEPTKRQTIRDILTKKRSIKGILTQKLW